MSTALMAPRKKRNTKGAAIAQAIVYYDENVPLFRRNGYRKSGTMILRVRSRGYRT